MRFKTKYEGVWRGAEDRLTPVIKSGESRFQRPVTKAGKCNQCGLCYLLCPCGCIDDRGSYFAADLEYCKGCGICARECPIGAIVMQREGKQA